MNTVQKVAVLIAATGLVSAAVLPGRNTADIVGKFFGGLSQWTKTAQGRG
jgi:hypothetical protein